MIFLRLMKLYRPYRNWMLLGVLLSLLSVLANVTLMTVSGWFIAAMGIAGVAGVSMNYFTPAGLIRGCSIIRTGGRYAERLVTHDATLLFLSGLRRTVYDHVERLSVSELSLYRSGTLLNRMGADIDRLERFYIGFVVPVLTAFIAGVVFVVFLSFYDAALAFTLAVLLMLSGCLFPLFISYRTRMLEQETVQDMTAMRTELVGSLQGLGELLVYDANEWYGAEQKDIERRVIEKQLCLNRYTVLSAAVLELSSYTALWFALLFGIPLVTAKVIAPAELVLLALFSLSVFESVMPLPAAFQSLNAVRESASRVFDLLDQAKKAPSNDDVFVSRTTVDSFNLEFKTVSFSYDQKEILKKVSFQMKKGEKLAVIGPTGSGKTSVINLVTGLWPHNDGDLLINGKSIEVYNRVEVRDFFAVVPQKPHIFSSTIRENLLLADPKAGEQDLELVCRKAGLLSFIQSLPDGFDHYVGEAGLQLSGGQIRRLAIARALLKKAPCLVLDEPGEGLDQQTESEIIESVMSSLEDRALLLITHSPVGLQDMDRIILLEDGKVIHNDTHDSLLKESGFYRSLYAFV